MNVYNTSDLRDGTPIPLLQPDSTPQIAAIMSVLGKVKHEVDVAASPMVGLAVTTIAETAALSDRVKRKPDTALAEFLNYRDGLLRQPSFVMDVLNIWYYSEVRPTAAIYQNWRIFFTNTMLNFFIGSLHAQAAPTLTVNEFKQQQLTDTVTAFKNTTRVEQEQPALQPYVAKLEHMAVEAYKVRAIATNVVAEEQKSKDYYFQQLLHNANIVPPPPPPSQPPEEVVSLSATAGITRVPSAHVVSFNVPAQPRTPSTTRVTPSNDAVARYPAETAATPGGGGGGGVRQPLLQYRNTGLVVAGGALAAAAAARWIGDWWSSSSSSSTLPSSSGLISAPVIVAIAQEKAREMATMPNWGLLGTVLLAGTAAAATYFGGPRRHRTLPSSRRTKSHHASGVTVLKSKKTHLSRRRRRPAIQHYTQ